MDIEKLGVPFEAIVADDLKDDDYVVALLNDALNEEDPHAFLLALRQVAKARGLGMSEIADKLQLNRRGLYHALSVKGNPGWLTLHGLLGLMGFSIQLAPKQGH